MAEVSEAPGPYTNVWSQNLSTNPIWVHRVSDVRPTARTACGLGMYSPGGYELGDFVPFRALNPTLTRLCGRCWRRAAAGGGRDG